jgi:hypothetical protein
VTVLAGYVGVLAACGLALYFLGLPWRVLLRAQDPFGERTMLLGLCVLVGVTWQWADLTGAGISTCLWLLALVNLPAFGWGVRRVWQGWRVLLRRTLPIVGAGAACLAVFATYYRDALGGLRPYPVALSNNDLPYYAIMGRHLVHDGMAAQGAVVGADFGAFLRADVFGAFDEIGAASYLVHQPTSVVLMPLLVLSMLLTVLGLARIIGHLTQLPPVLALAAGLVTCSSSLYFYSLGQGFFSQLIAMALFVALVALLLERATSSSSPMTLAGVFPGALEYGLYVVGLVCMYPHMAFLGVPVQLAIVITAVFLGSRALWATTFRTLAVVSGGFIVALLLDGSRVVDGARRSFLVGGSSGGWGFDRIKVSQIFGLSQFPHQRALPSQAPNYGKHLLALDPVLLLLLILAGVLLAVGLRLVAVRRSTRLRDLVGWCAAGLATPLATYYLLFALAGKIYLPWKWLAFFQPLAVAFVVTALAGALWALPTRIRTPATLVPLAVLLALTVAPTRLHHGLQANGLLTSLSQAPELAGAAGVNVDARTRGKFWDAMWVGYYLGPRRIVFRSLTYWPVQPADPHYPTLVLLPGNKFTVEPAISP